MPLVKCKAESLDLTANYTFTGDVSLSGGGALNLISTQTASSSASVSFTTGIDSTYDEYWFIFNNVNPQTGGAEFGFQGSTNGGSNYNLTITSTDFNAYHPEADWGQGLSYVTTHHQAQGTAFQSIADDGGGASDECVAGILKIYNPSSSTYVKHFISRMNCYNDGDLSVDIFVAGYFNTTSPINAFQFKYSSGNIDDGTIQLFGVSK